MHFETKRLKMRPFQLTDAEALFAMESLPEVHQYIGKKPAKSQDDVVRQIKWVQQQYDENGIGRSIVILKDNNKVIGWSGLKLEKHIRDFSYFDVGYRFHPDYWGNGFATESAIASLKFGFNVMNYTEICAAADQANVASNRILQKIGMVQGDSFVFENTPCNWFTIQKDQI